MGRVDITCLHSNHQEHKNRVINRVAVDVRNQVRYKLRRWIHRSLEEVDYNRVEALSQCREPSEGLLYIAVSTIW